MSATRLVGHGLSVEVPRHWEARIFRRAGAAPVMHVASFALHDGDGDFGAAATGRMGADDVFFALLEYLPDEHLRAGHGLFASLHLPRPAVSEFSPAALQVTRRGQLGWQRFFTHDGRPCCLYAVIRPGRLSAGSLVARLGSVLGSVARER